MNKTPIHNGWERGWNRIAANEPAAQSRTRDHADGVCSAVFS
jgi:hypothetical protein